MWTGLLVLCVVQTSVAQSPCDESDVSSLICAERTSMEACDGKETPQESSCNDDCAWYWCTWDGEQCVGRCSARILQEYDDHGDGGDTLPGWGFGIIGAVFSSLGLMMPLLLQRQMKWRKTVLTQGKESEGIVQNKSHYVSKGSNSEGPLLHWIIHVFYDADRDDGKRVRVELKGVEMTQPVWETLGPGSRVTLKYLPKAVDEVLIMEDKKHGEIADGMLPCLTCIGSIFVLVGFGVGVGISLAMGDFLGVVVYLLVSTCCFGTGFTICTSPQFKKAISTMADDDLQITEDPTGPLPCPGQSESEAPPQEQTMEPVIKGKVVRA
jgi:hypothetical protein